VKGPKDSKDSHTSVTMEGTLFGEWYGLQFSSFVSVNCELCECGSLPASLCVCVCVCVLPLLPRHQASYKRAPP
jgi:hypothetical protein